MLYLLIHMAFKLYSINKDGICKKNLKIYNVLLSKLQRHEILFSSKWYYS